MPKKCLNAFFGFSSQIPRLGLNKTDPFGGELKKPFPKARLFQPKKLAQPFPRPKFDFLFLCPFQKGFKKKVY